MPRAASSPLAPLDRQLAIGDALALLQAREEAWAYVTSTPPAPPLAVSLNALQRMVAMGLAHLPVVSVAHVVTQGAPTCPRWLTDTPLAQPKSIPLPQPLAQALSPLCHEALLALSQAFHQQGLKAYCVGGLPRDVLCQPATGVELHHPDLDVTVEGDAVAVAHTVASTSPHFTLSQAYPEFGTATLSYRNQLSIDLAATRTETYTACGAMPTVTHRGVALAQDVLRRDFTCNTLALPLRDPTHLLDTLGEGALAIEAKTLSLLHGASLFEDPSRLLRGMVFVSRLGFTPDTSFWFACEQWATTAPLTTWQGGGERVRVALLAWLALLQSPQHLGYLHQWLQVGGLRVIVALPNEVAQQAQTQAITYLQAIEPTLAHLPTMDFGQDEFCISEFWLLMLLVALPAPYHLLACDRLGLPKAQRQQVAVLHAWLADDDGSRARLEADLLAGQVSPLAVCQRWQGLGAAGVAVAVGLLPQVEAWQAIVPLYWHRWRAMAMAPALLSAEALLAMGVPQGKALGQVLATLKEQTMLGNLTTPPQAEAYVRQKYF